MTDPCESQHSAARPVPDYDLTITKEVLTKRIR